MARLFLGSGPNLQSFHDFQVTRMRKKWAPFGCDSECPLAQAGTRLLEPDERNL